MTTLLSNLPGRTPERKTKARILKSHQVAGFEVSTNALEQVALGDLPPSRIEEDRMVAKEAAVERSRKAALDTEARALAMERRAAALLKEAQETALDRLVQMEEQVDEALIRAVQSAQTMEIEGRNRGLEVGREEGLLHGREAGLLEGEALVRQARSEAESLTAEALASAEAVKLQAIRERSELLDASKAQVLDLAFAMARQILRAETTLRPVSMLPMLEAALAKLKGDLDVNIRVSTQVLGTLEEHRGRLLAAAPGTRHLALEGDQSMLAGDFVVQGSQGVVDGRIDEQVHVLDEAVRKER